VTPVVQYHEGIETKYLVKSGKKPISWIFYKGLAGVAGPAGNSMIMQRISQLVAQDPAQWAATAGRVLPPWITVLLVIAAAFKLAEVTWLLMPAGDLAPSMPVVPAASPARTAAPLDLEPVLTAHLFGEPSAAPAPVVQQVEDAPDTRLSLKLRGIVAGDDPSGGFAIVADSRGQEKLYKVGDAVPGGAKVHEVQDDRVILNRAGILEALRLPREFEASARGRANVPTRARPTQTQSSLRNVIASNASKISDIIRVAPHMEQGQMVGFRINPGRNRQQFASLGLRPGDVVTDINGTAMTDPSAGLQVFEALGESTQATVTVRRGGQDEVLVIDTSSLGELDQQRE
jgi:general secretion pathway protein C